MGEETFRAFVAVEIPDDLRARCARLVAALQEKAGGVSWVRAENLHLTLKFLGPTRPAQAERILESIAHKAAKLAPFAVALEGLGAFPSMRRPRVLWIGITEGSEALRDLAAKVDGAGAKAGFLREARAFSPHLTLGRVKMGRSRPQRSGARAPGGAKCQEEGRGADWPALLAATDPGPLGRFTVDGLVLVKSVLGPGGAVHTPLRRVPLGREAGPRTSRPGAGETS